LMSVESGREAAREAVESQQKKTYTPLSVVMAPWHVREMSHAEKEVLHVDGTVRMRRDKRESRREGME